MVIKIYGIGCEKQKTLVRNVQQAVEELGLEAEIVVIKEIEKLAAAGFSNPLGLTIDDEPVADGRLLSTEELKIVLEHFCESVA
jgi:small redox-active disulfide protein 2